MNDYEVLRKEYNAAVANSLIIKARRIERVMNAISKKKDTSR